MDYFMSLIITVMFYCKENKYVRHVVMMLWITTHNCTNDDLY